jgi:predicted nucleotidyltransferase
VDVLVEFEHPAGWKFFTIEMYLEDLFGLKIDPVTAGALKENLVLYI